MRTIGINLAISATHKAMVVDERGNAITPLLDVTADPAVLDDLFRRARDGADEEERLRIVMEPTSLSWLPIASYAIQREETVHLVNTQQVSDLRKFYSKHAKSDNAALLIRGSSHVLSNLACLLGRPPS